MSARDRSDVQRLHAELDPLWDHVFDLVESLEYVLDALHVKWNEHANSDGAKIDKEHFMYGFERAMLARRRRILSNDQLVALRSSRAGSFVNAITDLNAGYATSEQIEGKERELAESRSFATREESEYEKLVREAKCGVPICVNRLRLYEAVHGMTASAIAAAPAADNAAIAARVGQFTGKFGDREFRKGEEVIVSAPIAHDERHSLNGKPSDVQASEPDSAEVLANVEARKLTGTFKGTVYRDGRRIGWHDRPEMPSPVLRMPER